jgi:soluble lytic murein transglycosylase
MPLLATQEIRMLGAVLPATPATQHFLATLFVENQQYLEAFRLLNPLVETLSPADIRGVPQEFWITLYPRPYWQEVLGQAQDAALNPYLVLSMMRQESAFNAAAVSRAGARGLMQLMPATAQEVAKRLQLSNITSERLHEPRLSITLGINYFTRMLQRYQGNVILALAAYNAGPGRASRWREQWADVPMDEFIERIPLDETRLYVKFILRNLMMYERLYAGQ